MKQSAEQAHLILDNRQALSGAGRARTVYGVNFRELLGSMYNKYNKFLIVLNTYSSHSADWPNSSGYSNVGTVRMVGLNWAHSSYGVMNVYTHQIQISKKTFFFYFIALFRQALGLIPRMFIIF